MRRNATRIRAVLAAGIAFAVALVGLLFMSLYSAPQNHSREFTVPTLAYLRAGLALDSLALARLDVSPAALRWVLDRGRRDPALLKALAADLHQSGTRRSRDGAEVTFEAKGLARCGPWPLTVHFTGLPSATRIDHVATGCDPR